MASIQLYQQKGVQEYFDDTLTYSKLIQAHFCIGAEIILLAVDPPL